MKIAQHYREISQSFLSVLAARRKRNPFLVNATGLMLGLCVLDQLVSLCTTAPAIALGPLDRWVGTGLDTSAMGTAFSWVLNVVARTPTETYVFNSPGIAHNLIKLLLPCSLMLFFAPLGLLILKDLGKIDDMRKQGQNPASAL
jgi:hypothetical protein